MDGLSDPLDYDKSPDRPSPSTAIDADKLRRTSNVIQALENVMAQCGEDEYFERLKEMAAEALYKANERLRKLIHQPWAA